METPVSPDYTGRGRRLRPPKVQDELLREREEGSMLGIDVSEIHAYPLRLEGFEEPVFPTAKSNREIMEHLLEASWLSRASELEGRAGGAVHALEEPVELRMRNSSGRV